MIGIATGFVASFMAIVIISTLFIATPPLSIKNESLTGEIHGDDLFITYRRDLESRDSFFVLRVVRVICAGVAYSIPDSIHYYAEGEKTKGALTAYIAHGFTQKPGTSCTVKRALVWQPLFSMRHKAYNLPPLTFIVQPQAPTTMNVEHKR